MERHHGVFICTTNWLDRPDAALRRFTSAIEFAQSAPKWRRCSSLKRWRVTRLLHLAAHRQPADAAVPGRFCSIKRQIELLATALSSAWTNFLTQSKRSTASNPVAAAQHGFMPCAGSAAQVNLLLYQ
jgi:hypothetical protein